MKQLKAPCLEQVQNALELYQQVVQETELAPDTKRTYLRHAETFVRWLGGEFEPGGGHRKL